MFKKIDERLKRDPIYGLFLIYLWGGIGGIISLILLGILLKQH